MVILKAYRYLCVPSWQYGCDLILFCLVPDREMWRKSHEVRTADQVQIESFAVIDPLRPLFVAGNTAAQDFYL